MCNWLIVNSLVLVTPPIHTGWHDSCSSSGMARKPNMLVVDDVALEQALRRSLVEATYGDGVSPRRAATVILAATPN